MRIRWLLPFFFISGFCSLVCEVVWLRLCMATFGCNGPVVSVVLSVFMAGMGIGSFLIARSSRWLDERNWGRALRIYALCEASIAIGALLVPLLIEQARNLLATGLGGLGWASDGYYFVSGIMITLIVLPWTTFMGATLPLGMAAIRASGNASERTFSFLYAANLLGATMGTLSAALVLIELLGFHGTLLPAAFANMLVALGAYVLSRQSPETAAHAPASTPDVRQPPGPFGPAGTPVSARSLLFVAGLTTMALEIIWLRLYTVYLETSVYAFAKILGLYLVSNFLGSITYRRLAASGRLPPTPVFLSLIGLSATFALAGADPNYVSQVWIPNIRLVAGVAPFAFLSGCLTPLLVDRISAGSPSRAGRAYAWNIAGCIAGPLLASFVLLPLFGERASILLLAAPYFAYAVLSLRSDRRRTGSPGWTGAAGLLACAAATVALGLVFQTIYERVQTAHPNARLLRDFEASTIAFDDFPKPLHHLLVNGHGMSRKTPVTKTMAHFPLALLPRRPDRMLVICFGMGTTFRSAMSWGIHVDSVELVPSVPRMFDVFFPDARNCLGDPKGRIIIDDGRRFLARSNETYDVITIDPPPPVESAASSMLYSREFFRIARSRLRPGGILQHWVFGNRTKGTSASILRAARESFAYVRTFGSLEDWGVHILCSDSPIVVPGAAELASRMPAAAARDFVEWGPQATAQDQFARLLRGEVAPAAILALGPDAPAVTDDHPFNEYFLVRSHFPAFWGWWVHWRCDRD